MFCLFISTVKTAKNCRKSNQRSLSFLLHIDFLSFPIALWFIFCISSWISDQYTYYIFVSFVVQYDTAPSLPCTVDCILVLSFFSIAAKSVLSSILFSTLMAVFSCIQMSFCCMFCFYNVLMLLMFM